MSEWISVDDRLPDIIGDYICYDQGGEIAWAFFTSNKRWAYSSCYGEGGFYESVTHWMPLPEPPENKS